MPTPYKKPFWLNCPLLKVHHYTVCGCVNYRSCTVKVKVSLLWREISVKIMVYCLNLVMVYTLHSGGVEIPFLCGH